MLQKFFGIHDIENKKTIVAISQPDIRNKTHIFHKEILNRVVYKEDINNFYRNSYIKSEYNYNNLDSTTSVYSKYFANNFEIDQVNKIEKE